MKDCMNKIIIYDRLRNTILKERINEKINVEQAEVLCLAAPVSARSIRPLTFHRFITRLLFIHAAPRDYV